MIWRAFLFRFLFGFGLFGFIAQLSGDTPNPKVLWVKVDGTVELGLAPYIQRAIKTAEEKKMERLVLEIETFGGRVDAAVVIRDALLSSKVKTVAWVNHRAISAGALIALACDEIYFSPGSTMGAATPIQMDGEGAKDAGKKFVSYFRAEMGSTASAKNRDKKIAEAMVLAAEDIPGLIKAGDVLTLNDKNALETKISNGTVNNRDEFLSKISATTAEIENFEINWAETIVRFLTDPVVSGLLMSLGVLGIIFEIQSPGFGLPGILGIVSFALFFFGKFLVHLAGWEEVLLLIAGFVLIIVELFIFTGTFIFGILGFGCVLAALFLAGVSEHVPIDLDMPEIASHLRGLSFAFVAACLALIGLWVFISRNPSKAPLVLRTQLSKSSPGPKDHSSELAVGQLGTATSDLRPSGKAAFGEQVFDVETDGEYLARGAHIRITKIEGLRILVKRNES